MEVLGSQYSNAEPTDIRKIYVAPLLRDDSASAMPSSVDMLPPAFVARAIRARYAAQLIRVSPHMRVSAMLARRQRLPRLLLRL